MIGFAGTHTYFLQSLLKNYSDRSLSPTSAEAFLGAICRILPLFYETHCLSHP